MLEPHVRTLLVEALRPPPGYTLDCAICTTYSLDLLALMAVPLAFTFFDWQDDENPEANPLGLLEAVRRNADRICVFCQDDRIAVPRYYRGLFAYLESSVIPVRPPEHGSFHPKIWAIRFVSAREPVRYRLLVLTRNLTSDRSWDTVLALDGVLAQRRYAYSSNHPLGDFFAALVPMAAVPLTDRVAQQVDLVQDELRRVHFQPPGGFEAVAFHPLGIKGYRSWPFAGRRVDRMLVISPFLSGECLEKLALSGRDNILVSDIDALAALDEDTLARFSRVLVLQDGVEPEPEDNVERAADEATPDQDGSRDLPLTGLHAKVYVADAGWRAHLWTGSANATEAAFAQNVEFIVELSGRKSRCGIDAILGSGDGGLATLLRDYEPGERVPEDPRLIELEGKVDEGRRAIAQAGLVARVTMAEGANEHGLSLQLPRGRSLALPAGVRARCRPITLRAWRELDTYANRSRRRTVATFEPVSTEALTSFFAFEITARGDDRDLSAAFVLNLPLLGEPEDRRERILLSMLKNRDEVRRYLLLLLAEAASSPAEVLDVIRTLNGSGREDGRALLSLPLFEVMVKALHRNPESLDRVAQVISDLQKTPEGRDLLPEGLQAVWEPIWAARKGLVSASPK